MQLSIVSFNGITTINNGTNFKAFFPKGAVEQEVPGAPVFVPRSHFPPAYIMNNRSERYLPIYVQCLGTYHQDYDTLRKIFDTYADDGTKTLIVQDTANGNKQWQLTIGSVVSFVTDGSMVTVTLSVPDGVWQSVVQTSDVWNITTTGQTHDIATLGTRPVEPIFDIKPTGGKAGGATYKRTIIVYNKMAAALPKYPVELTGGGLNTSTLVSGGKMQADADDLRIFVDGIETNRWFGTGVHGVNTTGTYVWSVIDLSPKIEVTIEAVTTTATSLTLQNTTTNKNNIKLLPVPGMALIDSELITWTAKNINNLTISGLSRSAKGTTATSHTAGTTMRWIEHLIEMSYGDVDATAPVTDDTYKPIFSLNSTNTSVTYTSASFLSLDGRRAGEWKKGTIKTLAKPTIIPPKTEYFGTAYTSTNARTIPDAVDPYAVLGMSILSFQLGTKWKDEAGELSYQLYHPCGITDLTWNGFKWRTSASWPTKVFMQKSTDGKTFTSINTTLATPGSLSTWTAFTGSPTSLSGTYYYLKWYFAGGIAAGSLNESAVYIDTMVLTLASGNVPSVSLGAEQSSTYQIAAKLTNNTSGEFILINWLMKVNQTLRVDCQNHYVSLVDDNSPALAALTLSTVRADWLNLTPGTTVTLRFDDATTGDVTITTKFYDRTH